MKKETYINRIIQAYVNYYGEKDENDIKRLENYYNTCFDINDLKRVYKKVKKYL